MSLAPGDKFKITKRGHWGFGRIFTVHDLPDLKLAGNPDSVPLVWKPGELIEFRAVIGGKQSTFLIARAWVQPV